MLHVEPKIKDGIYKKNLIEEIIQMIGALCHLSRFSISITFWIVFLHSENIILTIFLRWTRHIVCTFFLKRYIGFHSDLATSDHRKKELRIYTTNTYLLKFLAACKFSAVCCDTIHMWSRERKWIQIFKKGTGLEGVSQIGLNISCI